ncbi:hypothetical protein N7454_008972 [Penicillium verhagenii]|nr:hypothetical protein N7454_008972 [Penicillium verhagenii]
MPHPQMPSSTSPAPLQQNYEYPEPPRPGNTNSGHINDAVNSAVYNNANSNAYLSPEVLSQITSTVIQQLKASGMGDMQSPQNTQPQYPPPPPRPQSYSQAQQPSWAPPPADLPLRPQSESPPSFTHATNDTRASSKPSQDPTARRSGSISSQGSVKTESRPKPPDRDATVMEMTTLEKVWGKLFADDKPTKRLGQFLRGIAMHLIEDYPPRNTIVIVPQKLQKFYADTQVPADANYPWKDIFDDNTSSISRLFREIKAEHHLVQLDDLTQRPDIPGLTPKGFEIWATLMIQAHPDREYARLQKAVLNMPINNPDDKKERFPKEIPRRLFPEVADLKIRETVELHIMKHCGVDLPAITDEERAKASRPKTSPLSSGRRSGLNSSRTSSAERSRSYERGRPPPAASSSTAVLDDEDETIAPAPIERERKPYSANPGGGKVYDESENPRRHRESFTARPSDMPSLSTPSHRASTSTIQRSPTRDSLYAQRTGSGPAPHSRHSGGRARTSRSSSRSMDGYRHSESDLLSRENTPRYGGVSSNDLYMASPTSMSSDVDDTTRRHASHRNSRTDEDYYRGMLGGQGGGPKYY